MSDNLNSTNYEEIITKLGVDVNELPDGLETTYLKKIIKLSLWWYSWSSLRK